MSRALNNRRSASPGRQRAVRTPQSAAGARGFTIIELVVVITIMIILVGVTMPAIKSLTRNNNQKQAVNLLTSMIANAHSMALQTHMPAGLVIYEDSATKGQNSAQLIVSTAASQSDFVRAPRSGPQPLPVGIRVAVLDDGSSTTFKGFRSGEYSTTGGGRIILFDGNGQLVLRNNLTASTDTASAALWFGSGANAAGISKPGFVVYNSNDLQAAKDKNLVTDDPSMAKWLQQFADVIIVNAYTGNVIR